MDDDFEESQCGFAPKETNTEIRKVLLRVSCSKRNTPLKACSNYYLLTGIHRYVRMARIHLSNRVIRTYGLGGMRNNWTLWVTLGKDDIALATAHTKPV